MAKYRKRTPLADAVPWFKVGDHPDVVAYPNPEDVIEDVCPKCGERPDVHGWIAAANAPSVCPGDFVVEDGLGDRFSMRPGPFHEQYELVADDG